MKINLRTVLLLVGVSLIVSGSYALAHTDVTAEQARELIDSTDDLIVIDVREPSEYSDTGGHIPGALNYPWYSGVFHAQYGELPMHSPVLVVCGSGSRSNRAANFLDSEGFSMVYDMLGGMRAWTWETVTGNEADTKYGGGTGEPNDPYLIYTADQLNAIGTEPNDWDKHFKLMADIDLSGYSYNTALIAPDTNDVEEGFQGIPFTGVIDGNGYAISNLHIQGGDYIGYLGLFGQLDSGAMVSNLGLEAVNVNGTGDYVGGLVGQNDGSIATSYSTGTVSGTGNYVGGLVANNGGSITASYSTSVVSGWSNVGGIVGYSFGNITTSYSTGTVSGDERVGGLVGSNGGSIATSYSTGTISGNKNVGGLVGSNSYASIAASFWDMETSGQTTSAGGTGLTKADMQDINTFLDAGWDFVDEVLNGTCDYWQISPGDSPMFSYHIGNNPVMPEGLGTAEEPYLIRDPRDLGTVWFKPSAHYRLEASINLSGITWSTAVIPWFGETFDGNGYVISNLRIQGGGHLGLFGELVSGAKISNLGLEAVDVNGIGYCVGGLVGDNRGSIATSYSTGTVSGKNWVGGLVGASFSYVTDCYSKGLVSGDDSVGGLMGRNRSGLERHATVTRCYTNGTVRGTSNVGGLVGFNYDSSITASFWDMETSGQTTSDGGAGKTTAEMQTAGTFLDAGWDFVGETENGTEDIWSICEGTNYPRFVWQITAGDFVCPDGITIDDFLFFLEYWLDDNCDSSNDYCQGTDLDQSGTVDVNDIEIFIENWPAER